MNLTVSIDPSCIKKLESTYVNSNVPKILVGDTVKIGVSITEGNKERIQFAQGVVIAKSNAGLNTTITVRRGNARYWCRKSVFSQFSKIKNY